TGRGAARPPVGLAGRPPRRDRRLPPARRRPVGPRPPRGRRAPGGRSAGTAAGLPRLVPVARGRPRRGAAAARLAAPHGRVHGLPRLPGGVLRRTVPARPRALRARL